MANYAGDELPQGIEIRKDGKVMTADEVVAELQAARQAPARPPKGEWCKRVTKWIIFLDGLKNAPLPKSQRNTASSVKKEIERYLEYGVNYPEAPASGEVEPVAMQYWWPESPRIKRIAPFDSSLKKRGAIVKPLVHADTHPPAKVPEALWEALADCVSCFNCPEWSDKCEEVERKATKLLNSTTPTPATTPETEWVKPSEDLPSEDGRNPVWYWDNYQGVMLIPEHEAHRRLLRSEAHNPHWMPTGLKRPEPPQEQ